jgi:23S rRNA pseudouridine955/2504/2580 synthase
MSGVETRTVDAADADVRLDRWFRRHFPEIGHGRLQRWLRTGQVRVDGRRVQANARLSPGQAIRIPPLPARQPAPASSTPAPDRTDPADAAWLRSRIVFEDQALIVLDKPAGLAVQGGTGTRRHVDGMLQAWAAGGERPRLVHRLDRDTSGLLVVAKTAAAAAKLTAAFRRHRVDKLYWALVVGRPPVAQGWIDQPLAKQPGRGGERVAAAAAGVPARTLYRVVDRAGRVASWLALKPLTGRTHQLRAHCALLGRPIIGDGKYGGARAHPEGAPKGLMLHAREIRLPHPDGGAMECTAPPSATLLAGFRWLGFEPDPTLPGARLADFEPS